MQMVLNLAGTEHQLTENGCALMDHLRSRGSHLHLQVLQPCDSQYRTIEGSWLSPDHLVHPWIQSEDPEASWQSQQDFERKSLCKVLCKDLGMGIVGGEPKT